MALIDELTEEIPCGDGTCKLANSCRSAHSPDCDVCMYNTGATPRGFYEGPLNHDDLDDFIVT